MELIIGIISLIVGVALIVSVLSISSNTKRSALLLQELLFFQLTRDGVTMAEINSAATDKLISHSQHEYLLQRHRDLHGA